MMNHNPEYNEVRAILKDVAASQKRAEKRLAEERQKDNETHDKEMARIQETHKKDMARIQETHDKEMARMAKSKKEADKREKRLDKRLARIAAEHEKAVANMKKSKKEADLRHKRLNEQLAKASRVSAEASRVSKENGKHLGGFTTNYGKAVENEFAEALRKTKKIGEIKLDEVKVHIGKQFEFDLVAINSEIAIVGEIKVRLTHLDVRRFVKQRLPHFAEHCPEDAHARHIYGMVGAEIMTDGAKAEAEKHGLFIARLENKKIIIDDVNTRALH